MAVKIKLTRLGKIRNPQYRIAVADARNRRDGRAIEVIGRYHPKEEPSLIEIDSERAQYWLSVGAQPTEPVLKLLKITGDWQKFKGPARRGGQAEGRPAQAEQTRAVQRRPGRRRRCSRHRGRHAEEEESSGEEGRQAEKADGADVAPKPAAEAERRRRAGRAGDRELTTAMSTVVVDAVEHLVRGIVDNPDDVRVDLVTSRRGRTVEVHVHPDDLGKVIGRGGRTATALRTLVAGIGGRGIRVDVVDTDQ